MYGKLVLFNVYCVKSNQTFLFADKHHKFTLPLLRDCCCLEEATQRYSSVHWAVFYNYQAVTVIKRQSTTVNATNLQEL